MSVEIARKKAPPETPEEYFTKFRAMQQKTVFALNRRHAAILDQHKAELRSRLEFAASEELLELSEAEDITKCPAFMKYFKSYGQIFLDQFAIRQRVVLGITRDWTAQITSLNSNYGIK